MNRAIDLRDIAPIIQEQLAAGGAAILTVNGTSMSPLFKDKKTVVRIEKCVSAPKKYDIIFYRREDGSFILHRIIGTKNGHYICRGDNQFENEYPVAPSSIIGQVSLYKTKKDFERVGSFKETVYSRFWVNTMIFRRTWRRIVDFIKQK